MTVPDVVVIGAGAAGLMCAIEAGKRGRSVVVLERNDTVGKKIRISGGGRCNFTNLNTQPDNFITENRNFHKSALARYSPHDFIELVKKHGIRFHEKKLGQLFCNESAQQIIQLLLDECHDAKVSIDTGVSIENVSATDRGFVVECRNHNLECRSLVIATGGLSIPKIGATDFGYTVARQFGIRLTRLRPGLVPFTFDPHQARAFAELSGVSFEAVVRFEDSSFRENVLFTHRGLSGPAILQISSYWQPGRAIQIDLLPDTEITAEVLGHLHHYVPRRLSQAWQQLHGAAKSPAQISNKELARAADHLHNWVLTPAGTEGYAKAEVTVGGVATGELSSKTMETRRVPGLFFIGEVVDVTGHLGGFNFQWAWASGFVAGQAV